MRTLKYEIIFLIINLIYLKYIYNINIHIYTHTMCVAHVRLYAVYTHILCILILYYISRYMDFK